MRRVRGREEQGGAGEQIDPAVGREAWMVEEEKLALTSSLRALPRQPALPLFLWLLVLWMMR